MSFSRAPTDRLPSTLPSARKTPGGNSTICFGTDGHSFPQRREQTGSRYVQQQQRREQTYRRAEQPQQQRRDLTPVGGRSTLVLGTDRETTPRSTQRAIHQKINKEEYTITPRMTGHTAGGKSTIDLSTNEYPSHQHQGGTTPVSSAHSVHRGFALQESQPLCLPARPLSPVSPRFARSGHNTGNGGTPRNGAHAAGSRAPTYTSSYTPEGSTTPRGAPTTPRQMVTTPRHMCPPGGNSTICLGTDERKMVKTEKQKNNQFSMELDVTSSTVCDFDDGQKCSPTVPPRRLDVAYNACMLTRGTPPGGNSSIRLG